jgi:hypothetical protein
MQQKTKGETGKTFRRQVRFPKELIEAIEVKSGKGNFSQWVISSLWDAVKRDGNNDSGDSLPVNLND